jgi:hypothetical protein
VDESKPKRRVGILLGLLIVSIPFIGVWFVLRPGHTRRARILSVGYFAIVLVALMIDSRADDPHREMWTSSGGTAVVEATNATASSLENVYVGMPADDVLQFYPREDMTSAPEVIATDAHGLVTRWSYPGVDLVLARRQGECPENVDEVDCYCYRVMRIESR